LRAGGLVPGVIPSLYLTNCLLLKFRPPRCSYVLAVGFIILHEGVVSAETVRVANTCNRILNTKSAIARLFADPANATHHDARTQQHQFRADCRGLLLAAVVTTTNPHNDPRPGLSIQVACTHRNLLRVAVKRLARGPWPSHRRPRSLRGGGGRPGQQHHGVTGGLRSRWVDQLLAPSPLARRSHPLTPSAT
jgi:hypothetical protein